MAIPNTPFKLSLDNVTAFIRQRPLFDAITFSVTAGCVVHISGNNGSGKSTLLRLIAGLSPSEQGSILWQDTSIYRNSAFQQNSLYLGHKNGLKDNLTAAEMVGFYQSLLNHQGGNVDELLLTLDLLSVADTPVRHLSFGQQRRLALSRLVLSPAKLWILDEPYTGIDVYGRALLNTLCVNHLQSGGLIVLTHHGELEAALAEQAQQVSL